MNHDNVLPCLCIGFALGLLIAAFISLTIYSPSTTIDKLIETGHAQYNQTTGEFELIPVKNKEK